MHIYYLSVSINILNLIFIHTTTIICMGIVTATAGLWAAKGLWQFVPVCAGYYQFETVCDSLWQPARHKLFVTVILPTLIHQSTWKWGFWTMWAIANCSLDWWVFFVVGLVKDTCGSHVHVLKVFYLIILNSIAFFTVVHLTLGKSISLHGSCYPSVGVTWATRHGVIN